MKHFKFDPTPVEKLLFYSNKWNQHVFCKRDDLFSHAGGGSKARMLQYILYPLLENKVKIMITAGGPCSNYNRAAALMCANLGIKMILVSYTEFPEEYDTSLNHYIVKLAGVNFIFCSKHEVPQVLKKTIDEVKKSNESYQYLYGGGKSLQGVYAYFDAIKELREQFTSPLDELYIACGTGTTLTGVCAGMQEFFPETSIHAISVARSWELEKETLDENMFSINNYLDKKYDFSNLVFHDEFLLGGYGSTTKEQLEVIRECVTKQGLLIDPTYSGKAFYGMYKILSNTKRKRKNVLFWHTGGLLNLLSQRKEFKL